MSCTICRDIGDFKTIQYVYPDEFCPEGSFELWGGDSYYNITGVKYCPFCGDKLKPPKDIANCKKDMSKRSEVKLKPFNQLATWDDVAKAMKEWTNIK